MPFASIRFFPRRPIPTVRVPRRIHRTDQNHRTQNVCGQLRVRDVQLEFVRRPQQETRKALVEPIAAQSVTRAGHAECADHRVAVAEDRNTHRVQSLEVLLPIEAVAPLLDLRTFILELLSVGYRVVGEPSKLDCSIMSNSSSSSRFARIAFPAAAYKGVRLPIPDPSTPRCRRTLDGCRPHRRAP